MKKNTMMTDSFIVKSVAHIKKYIEENVIKNNLGFPSSNFSGCRQIVFYLVVSFIVDASDNKEDAEYQIDILSNELKKLFFNDENKIFENKEKYKKQG